MKALLYFVVVLALTRADSANTNNCLSIAVNGSSIYNVLPFNTPYTASNEEGTLSFSVCSANITNCNTTQGLIFGTFSNPNCTVAADSTLPSYTYNNATNGLQIAYAPYQDANNWTTVLTVQLVCDVNATTYAEPSTIAWVLDTVYGNKSTTLTVTGVSKYGCPYASLSGFLGFLEKYQNLFVVIFFLGGIFISLFGLKMFDIVVFVVVATGSTFILGSLFYENVNPDVASGGEMWGIFALCIILGCAVGYLTVKFEKVAFFGLGFVAGGIGALMLYQLVLSAFIHTTSPVFLYVTIGLLGIVGGLLSLWIWKDVIIIATSAIGSYMSIRALSVWFHGFPSEVAIANGTAHFTPVAYAYLAAIVLWTFFGIFFQLKHKKEQEDKQQEDDPTNIYKNLSPDA